MRAFFETLQLSVLILLIGHIGWVFFFLAHIGLPLLMLFSHLCHSLCSEDAQKCKRKLYMVPSKAIASCWRLKLFANVGSVNAHVKREENCVCSNSSGPSDFSRLVDP